MPHEHPTVHDAPAVHAPPRAQETIAYAPIGEEVCLDQPDELPRRPRRRLLTPLPLTLVAVLLIACGFIGGVLVEKGQSSSSPGPGGGGGGLAARFAALRGGASATGARSGSSTGAAGAFLGRGGAGRTAGTVAYLAGRTLYVTTAEGGTVKVDTSAGTTVSKTVSSHVKAIHPGETVTVIGAAATDGAVSAESIDVGSAGGGLAALFGASGARVGSTGAGAPSGGGASGGAQALFGSGG